MAAVPDRVQSAPSSALPLNAIFIVFSRARAILGVKPIIRRKEECQCSRLEGSYINYVTHTVKDLQYSTSRLMHYD